MPDPFSVVAEPYDTPLGPVPVDRDFYEALAARAGQDLLASEAAHRREHSIEFQTVMLQYLLGRRRPFTILPVLASYLHEAVWRRSRPESDARVPRFVDALREKAEKLRIGSPMDPNTEMGPLISKQHREKVLSYYRLAGEEGAHRVTGGGTPHFRSPLDNGFYVEPTIYTGLAESTRCVKEEIFGPVCHVAPFDTEEEAIRMANDSKYGLAASIWTSNLKRGHRVAQQMNVGITWVNCWFLRDLRTPFGGVGLSGIGREGGVHSLNFYSELNNICIRL